MEICARLLIRGCAFDIDSRYLPISSRASANAEIYFPMMVDIFASISLAAIHAVVAAKWRNVYQVDGDVGSTCIPLPALIDTNRIIVVIVLTPRSVAHTFGLQDCGCNRGDGHVLLLGRRCAEEGRA